MAKLELALTCLVREFLRYCSGAFVIDKDGVRFSSEPSTGFR